MKNQRNWSNEEDLLVITEFCNRYKSEDWSEILLDLTVKIKTSKASIRARLKTYKIFLEGQYPSGHESISDAMDAVMLSMSISKSKMIYIFE